MSKSPVDDQIKSVNWVREHLSRILPSLVGQKLMSEGEADEVIKGLEDAAATLAWLKDNRARIAAALGAR